MKNDIGFGGEPVVDPSVLNRVVGEDMNIHRRFLNKFIGPGEETLEQIHVAFEARAIKNIWELSHKLKSSSRTIGAQALGCLCEKIEVAGKADDWASIDALHPLLDDQFRTLKTFIDNY